MKPESLAALAQAAGMIADQQSEIEKLEKQSRQIAVALGLILEQAGGTLAIPLDLLKNIKPSRLGGLELKTWSDDGNQLWMISGGLRRAEEMPKKTCGMCEERPAVDGGPAICEVCLQKLESLEGVNMLKVDQPLGREELGKIFRPGKE